MLTGWFIGNMGDVKIKVTVPFPCHLGGRKEKLDVPCDLKWMEKGREKEHFRVWKQRCWSLRNAIYTNRFA